MKKHVKNGWVNLKFIKFCKLINKWFWSQSKKKMVKITPKEYHKRFIEGRSSEEIRITYEKAWASKNFEIENYWKRANYLWLMQASIFLGYFTCLNSEKIGANSYLTFYINCIGIVISWSWFLINKGSKTWQRNWERHIDMLENYITGPLYKTVYSKDSFSVSKINELVSLFFVIIWSIITFSSLKNNQYLNISVDSEFDLNILFSLGGVILFVWISFFGYGRGRFGKQKRSFYDRDKHF